jgi:cellulose synthase/poly-beta-1,6-N-acetylglucosamine synthase-like glycosyltransferase
MPVVLFLSCLLTAYGPLLSILWLYLFKHPLLIMLSLASACSYILTVLVTSTIWKLTNPSHFILIIINTLLLTIQKILLCLLSVSIQQKLDKIEKYERLEYDFSIIYGNVFIGSLIQYISPLVQSIGAGFLESSCGIDVLYLGMYCLLFASRSQILYSTVTLLLS